MGQERPLVVEEKDLGCNEFPHNIIIQPIATEENTGPDYDTSIGSGVFENNSFVNDLMEISPNPLVNQLIITLNVDQAADIRIEIFDLQGKKLWSLFNERMNPGKKIISRELGDLASGIYTIQTSSRDTLKGIEKIQTLNFVKQ
jgi:hypothetical protein